MNSEQTTKYLGDLLDVELSIYVQEKSIEKMKRSCNSLCRERNLRIPIREVATADYFGSAYAYGIAGFIIATAIGTVVGTIAGVLGSEWWIFTIVFKFFISLILSAVKYGIVAAIIGGFVGCLIEKSKANKKQKELDEEYESQLVGHIVDSDREKSRLADEAVKKKYLEKEIELMTEILKRSYNSRKMLYEQNLLHRDYHDLISVGTIYGYFVKGQTQSLSFDPKTGDQGAYNIYENQRRLDMIITNTEEILKKMDTIIQTQYELADGLVRAEKRIGVLCRGVNDFMQSANSKLDRIGECAELTAYNTERAARELEYQSWLTIVR